MEAFLFKCGCLYSRGYTNNISEGWHRQIKKLVGKAHSNIYKAVTLFKSEQAAMDVSLMELAAEGLQKGIENLRTDFQL